MGRMTITSDHYYGPHRPMDVGHDGPQIQKWALRSPQTASCTVKPSDSRLHRVYCLITSHRFLISTKQGSCSLVPAAL